MATKNVHGSIERRPTTSIALSPRRAWLSKSSIVRSMNAHTASTANAAMPSANSHCNRRRGRPARAAVASARLLKAARVGTSMCIDITPRSDKRSIELRQRASGIRELWKLPLRGRRRIQRLACAVLVADLRVGEAEVVLDRRVVWYLRSAFLEQRERTLIDATLVQDPAERIRNARVVRRHLFCHLGQLERFFFVAVVFRIEPRQIVRGRRKPWIDGKRLGVSLLSLRDVAALLLQKAEHHEGWKAGRRDLVRLLELRDSLIQLLLPGIDRS